MRFLGALAAAIVIALAVTAIPATPAQASTRVLCVGYDACARGGYSNHGYKPKRDNLYWRMAGDHNCTNYVAYLLVKKGMVNVRPWVGDGNAYAWGDFTTDYRDSVPVVGAVAWWDSNRAPASSTGHVSYVEKVISKTEIIVSEDNWKGEFRWKRITKSGGGWPSAFIHFKDSRTPKLPAWSATQVSQSVWTDATKTTAVVSAALHPGSSVWVELRYTNTGSKPWKGVTLGRQEPPSVGWVAPEVNAKQKETSVSPGKVATFGFAVTIPEDAPSGTKWSEHFAPRTSTGRVMAQTDAWVQFGVDDRTDFASRPVPTISGILAETNTVSAVAGAWPSEATLAYTWKRDGVVIPTATAVDYTLVAADVGRKITVTVSAKADDRLPSLQTSLPSVRVASQYDDRLLPGEKLAPGAMIVSENGVYMLTQRTDGNLVIYDRRTMIPLWASATSGDKRSAKLSTNGSLVVVSTRGVTLWSSATRGSKSAKAVIRNDGKLVLYSRSSRVIWTSATSGR